MRIRVKTDFRTVDDLRSGNFPQGVKDPDNRLEMAESKKLTLERNPILRDGAKAQIIGSVDGLVMGRLNVFMYGVRADDKVYEALGGDSLWVDERYRKTLYALDLVELHNNLSADRLSLNTGISTDAQNLFRMSGNKMFPMLKFALVRHCSGLLEQRMPVWARRVVGPILDIGFWFQRLRFAMTVRKEVRGWRFEPVDTADTAVMEEFSALVRQDRHRFGVSVTSDWLKWVTENDFDSHRDKRLYRCWDGDRFVGFVLLRVPGDGHGRGKIKEWQVTEEYKDREAWLLLAAARFLIEQCDFVIVSFSADERAMTQIVGKSLMRLPDQYVTLGLGAGCPLKGHLGYDDSRNWRIRPAMGDVCFY